MSIHFPTWNLPDVKGVRVGVITARFNGEITSLLLEGARQCLREHAATCEEFSVPGAFELPFASQKIADRFDAVVACQFDRTKPNLEYRQPFPAREG